MKIAELFIGLGIKGDGKSRNALTQVNKGLAEVKSTGLGAKAAIAAAIFGLERLMSSSAKSGTNLLNFASITGLSAKNLQQWQYAASQAGISSESLQGSVESVQKAITDMRLTGQAPAGFGIFADKVGLDVKRLDDTFYVLKKMQEFSQKVRPDVAANILGQLGLSSDVIAGMTRDVFNPEVFKQAPIFDDRTVGRLNKVYAAWGNLGHRIQMIIGQLSADHGLQIIQELGRTANQVAGLLNGLAKFAEQIQLFTAINFTLKSTTHVLKTMMEVIQIFEKKGIWGGVKESYWGMVEAIHGARLTAQEKLSGTVLDFSKLDLFQPTSNTPKWMQPSNQQITVNQNFTAKDNMNPREIGQSAKKAVIDAGRQLQNTSKVKN